MSYLKIYSNQSNIPLQETSNFTVIQSTLEKVGIYFDRWLTNKNLDYDSLENHIISTYENEINLIKNRYSFQSIDTVAVNLDTINISQMRQKFLQEHTHIEDEIRFFVDGSGLFYIHLNDKVYGILCKKNDILHIPANTKHWFDLGANPFLKCIRFFTNPSGWVAEFTNSQIEQLYPLYD